MGKEVVEISEIQMLLLVIFDTKTPLKNSHDAYTINEGNRDRELGLFKKRVR